MSNEVPAIPLGIASSASAENDFTIIPLAPAVEILLEMPNVLLTISTEQDECDGLMTLVRVNNGAGDALRLRLPAAADYVQDTIVDFASHVLKECKGKPNRFDYTDFSHGSLWITTPAGSIRVGDHGKDRCGIVVEMYLGFADGKDIPSIAYSF